MNAVADHDWRRRARGELKKIGIDPRPAPCSDQVGDLQREVVSLRDEVRRLAHDLVAIGARFDDLAEQVMDDLADSRPPVPEAPSAKRGSSSWRQRARTKR